MRPVRGVGARLRSRKAGNRLAQLYFGGCEKCTPQRPRIRGRQSWGTPPHRGGGGTRPPGRERRRPAHRRTPGGKGDGSRPPLPPLLSWRMGRPTAHPPLLLQKPPVGPGAGRWGQPPPRMPPPRRGWS